LHELTLNIQLSPKSGLVSCSNAKKLKKSKTISYSNRVLQIVYRTHIQPNSTCHMAQDWHFSALQCDSSFI